MRAGGARASAAARRSFFRLRSSCSSSSSSAVVHAACAASRHWCSLSDSRRYPSALSTRPDMTDRACSTWSRLRQ